MIIKKTLCRRERTKMNDILNLYKTAEDKTYVFVTTALAKQSLLPSFLSPEPPFLLVTWSAKRTALVAAITGCP